MKKLLIPAGLLALSACATTTQHVPLAAAREIGATEIMSLDWFGPDADRPVPVDIVREGGYVGMRMRTMLVVDGRAVAMLPPERRSTLFLAPGKHVLAIGYARHPDSRPLVQQQFEVVEGQPNRLALRLFLGQDPAFEPLGDDAQAAADDAAEPQSSGETRYFLPACDETGGAGSAGAGSTGIRIVAGHACATAPQAAAGAAPPRPSWSDLGNLEEYAEPASIASSIDAALQASGWHDRLVGKTGRHLPEGERYVYTRRAGWLDLKHVMATLSNPLIAVPGASRFASWAVEVAQMVVAPMSAFRKEDEVSNHIGADAALARLYRPGASRSRGAIVQAAVDRLEPMTREQAFAHFGIEGEGAR